MNNAYQSTHDRTSCVSSEVNMSLDVYLTIPNTRLPEKPAEPAIYIRADGATKQITRAKWDNLYPNCEPVVVETSISDSETITVYSQNITHNLGDMADAAGIYECMWHPETTGIKKASQLIQPLRDGLALLNSDPNQFEAFNPPNGWGNYKGLCEFVADYLKACQEYPDADVSVWR